MGRMHTHTVSHQRPWRAVGLPTVAVAFLAGGCNLEVCGDADARAAREALPAVRQSAPPLADQVDRGLAELADWDNLPALRAAHIRQFSSYNRTPGDSLLEPGGKDFNNFIAVAGRLPWLLLSDYDTADPEEGAIRGHILASLDDGPGYVTRIFLTRVDLLDLLPGDNLLSSTRLGRFDGEVLHVYIDDLDRPTVVLPVADFGAAAPFDAPLAGFTSAAVVSYTPISFQRRLRISLDGLCPAAFYFYQVDVKQSAEATRAFSPRLADDPLHGTVLANLSRLCGGAEPSTMLTLDLPAGGATTFHTDAEGGTLTRLHIHAANATAATLNHVRLRIFFDDAGEPAVDVPVAAFFSCREQLASFETLPLTVTADNDGFAGCCRLPMPYARNCRASLENDNPASVTLRVGVAVDRRLPPAPWGYLHARLFAVDGPQPAGTVFRVIGVEGRGRYVGTCLFAAGRAERRLAQPPSGLNILEGNELGVIDGEPRLPGTGTEDYFNAGFYFARGPFNHPFAAANYVYKGSAGEPGVVSCSRWHVLTDAIDFQQSFVLRFQYGVDNPALVVRYATVAYYYLDRPAPGNVTGGTVAEP